MQVKFQQYLVPFTPVITEKNIELNYEKQKETEDNAHTTDTESRQYLT